MCNNWVEFGQCRYHNKCRFAHGEQELRVARRIHSDKNWKSELCRNYHSEGTCTYGRRCHFIHEETPAELARMHATQKRVGGRKSQRRPTPRTEKQHPCAASLAPVAAAEAPEEQQQVETKVPVGAPSLLSATSSPSPSAATLALASDVASLRLHGPVVQQLAHEEATTKVAATSSFSSSSPSHSLSSSSVTAPLVSSPMPISRKRSLQRFCHLVGLPVEATNPNEAAAAEPVSSESPPSGESPPFLLRPQAAFAHMHGKIMYEPKTPFTPATAPRTPPRMENDSPAKRRVRLPVFTRIASDTGVAVNPPSPVTTSP